MKGGKGTKRASRAQKVIEQARRAKEGKAQLLDLPSARLERDVSGGQTKLVAIFPRKRGGAPERVDLACLLEYPGLCDVFADAFLSWGKKQRQVTRNGLVAQLRAGWLAYLDETGLKAIGLQQLNQQILTGFKIWLKGRVKPDGSALHPNTISFQLSKLRTMVKHIPGQNDLLDIIPSSPRGGDRKTTPTEVLQFGQLLQVMEAVEKEVLSLNARWNEGRRLLELGKRLLADGVSLLPNPRGNSQVASEQNLALTLAMLDSRYPGVIPERPSIRKDDPLLEGTIGYGVGIDVAVSYFYASARDLVPLVLSIALATVFNPYTALKLCWRNIDRNVDRLGNGQKGVQIDPGEDEEDGESNTDEADLEQSEEALTKIVGDKPRARRNLVRLLDPEASATNQVSLNLVLDLLTWMTARVRPHIEDKDQFGDRVFVFVTKRGRKRARGFDLDRIRADSSWSQALHGFISDNQLPDFALKTIRATLLDYVQLFRRGDLLAAQEVGNHRDRVITWTHYTSSLVKKLLQESVGETMLVRERWISTNGLIDPRKFGRWTDKGCATPGWTCLDPFDSPRPNQKKGSTCSAYGECPDCPLSAARPKNPTNVMLYEALRRAIYRSVARVTPAVWKQRWAPVVAALDALLALVPSKVLDESRTIAIELPEVG
jgi:hypothetical protein